MHAEEMGVGLTGNRLGQHRFARARRADQQNAFGQPATQALILLWVAQEIHHLGHFAFGFFDTGHVVETDGRPLRDAGIFPAANIALIHHHTDDHADDQQVGKDHDPLANALVGDFDLCPTLVEQGFNLGLIEVRCDEDSLGIAGQLVFAFQMVNAGVGRWPDAAVGEGFCLDKLVQFGARDLARWGPETPDAEEDQAGHKQSGPDHQFGVFQNFHVRRVSVAN